LIGNVGKAKRSLTGLAGVHPPGKKLGEEATLHPAGRFVETEDRFYGYVWERMSGVSSWMAKFPRLI
jgi:hypothetical protein